MASIPKALAAAKRLFAGIASQAGSNQDAATAAGSLWATVKRAIEDTAEDRVAVQKLRDFYDGEQIRGTGLNNGTFYISTWPDESTTDMSTRADRMEKLVWNRTREGVLAHADALYAWGKGRAVNRSVAWDEDSEAGDDVREYLNVFFRRFWRRNRFGKFCWDAWRTTGAERSALVMHMWLDASDWRMRRFPAGAGRQAHRDGGLVWLELLDNLKCVALPNVEQNRELGAVIRWYRDPDSTSVMLQSEPTPGMQGTITEIITDDLWVRWNGSELVETPWGTTNRYGDVRRVFTWVRNPGDIADSEDAISPQMLLNEHTYNGAEIRRNHAFPETLYKMYDPPSVDVGGVKVLQRGPNVAHVAHDKDAEIMKVGPPAKLNEAGIGGGDIHQMLDDAMGLAGTDRGQGSSLGQIRSAPALGKTQARSERRRRRKLLGVEAWEQDVFAATRDIAVFHSFGKSKVKTVSDSRVMVTFPDDAFTMDPFTEAQKDLIELTGGMSTVEDQVRKRHPDLSDEEITEKVAEIKAQDAAKQGAARESNPSSTAQSNDQLDVKGKRG
jgi:hypothetical protein